MHTLDTLSRDLLKLGVSDGDGVFVHASMKSIGPSEGGPSVIVQALLQSVGKTGLIGMPGFSTDAYFPTGLNPDLLSPGQRAEIEDAVPGFDVEASPTSGVGIIAETFRTWSETKRSDHPSLSVCLNGQGAEAYATEHSLAWGLGPKTPFGKLYDHPCMKILLIGVGWNRCSALHMAETIAPHRRTKADRFKISRQDNTWVEVTEVADDNSRLFPQVGKAFEDTGVVIIGALGDAECRLCDFRALVDFASEWIDDANRRSGDRH